MPLAIAAPARVNVLHVGNGISPQNAQDSRVSKSLTSSQVLINASSLSAAVLNRYSVEFVDDSKVFAEIAFAVLQRTQIELLISSGKPMVVEVTFLLRMHQ